MILTLVKWRKQIIRWYNERSTLNRLGLIWQWLLIGVIIYGVLRYSNNAASALSWLKEITKTTRIDESSHMGMGCFFFKIVADARYLEWSAHVQSHGRESINSLRSITRSLNLMAWLFVVVEFIEQHSAIECDRIADRCCYFFVDRNRFFLVANVWIIRFPEMTFRVYVFSFISQECFFPSKKEVEIERETDI